MPESSMDETGRLRDRWTALSDYWINLMEANQSIHREGMLDGWMLEAVGDVTGLKVIDLGCGEGRFSRMLAERGAGVTGVDFCEPFIEYAQQHRARDEEYLLGDMQNLQGVPDAEYDLAVSYVTLVDVHDYRAAIREAHRVLRPGGRFIVCNLQSMVTAGMGWIKHGETKLHYRLDDYFDEGKRLLKLSEHQLPNYHRTLSNYVNSFLDAGFVVEGLREPTPILEQVERYPYIADNLRVPEFIIYLLRKPADAP